MYYPYFPRQIKKDPEQPSGFFLIFQESINAPYSALLSFVNAIALIFVIEVIFSFNKQIKKL